MTQVYLIRHAEKDTMINDPGLTHAGFKRAENLAYILKDAGIQFIHSTDFLRTRQTVHPLASVLDLEIQLYNHKDLTLLKEHMLELRGIHLVSGHSNSTHELVELFGGDPGSSIDEATEFDRLYLLIITDDGLVSTSILRYSSK
jgi:phosphohistidine phosphatase SixA